MRKLLHNKIFLIASSLFVLAVLLLTADQVVTVHKAHSTFDNYYKFRGCTQLLQKTATYGVCKTGSGQQIKMVLYHGKWYLDGDLPTCSLDICL